MFNFLRKFHKVEKRTLGINQRNRELIYAFNNRADYILADDKIITKGILEKRGIACAETFLTIEKVGHIEKKWEQMTPHQAIAIKPANGSGGGGIKILKRNARGQWMTGGEIITTRQIFKHLASILTGVYSLNGKDSVLIEECIQPHTFFSEIYPAGVPDFRVILLKQHALLAMLRVPTDKSDGKANLHQGGLGIGIDMKKGTLTNAFDGNKHYPFHPDNGHHIFGKKIPLWKEIMDISYATAHAFPLDYLGIDITLDQHKGPLVMEVNVRPGLGIQNVNQIGLKEILLSTPQFKNTLQA